MQIAIVGAGGVGGYYGTLLARAGHEVTVFARGEHLEAIQANGLTVEDHESTYSALVKATNDISKLNDAELLIVAVKGYSLTEIIPAVIVAATAGAVVLPMLNGVDAAERLKDGGVPAASIIGGATFVSASRVRPGVIRRHSTGERIVVGELDGRLTERVDRIGTALRSTGIKTIITETIEVELWTKFNFICAVSAACGLARGSLGAVRSRKMGQVLIDRAVGEIAAVARAKGIAIPEDQEERTLRIIAEWPDTLRPSFLLDVERGGPTELSVMSGTVSRLGSTLGVPTPVHDTATAALPD